MAEDYPVVAREEGLSLDDAIEISVKSGGTAPTERYEYDPSILGELRTGIDRVGPAASEMLGGFLQYAGDASENTELSQRGAEWAERSADDLAGLPTEINTLGDVKNLSQFLQFIAGQGPSSVAPTAAALAAGGATAMSGGSAPLIAGAAAAGSAPFLFGASHRENLEAGMTPEEAVNYTTMIGAGQTALEAMGGKIILSPLDAMVSAAKNSIDTTAERAGRAYLRRTGDEIGAEVVKEAGKRSMIQKAREGFVRGAVTEAGVEAGQEAIQMTGVGDYMGENIVGSPEGLQRLLDAAVLGGATGGILGAPIAAVQDERSPVERLMDAQEATAQRKGDATKESPRTVEVAGDLDDLAEQVNTEPTEGQKSAENYKMAHTKWKGLDISIETPKGSIRSGTAPDGTEWQVEMPADYGRVKGTRAADGELLDVYYGPNPENDTVWVVDQMNLEDGSYDEAKAIIGVDSEAEARALYEAGFSDGRGADRIGAISEMSVDEFTEFVKTEAAAAPVGDISGFSVDKLMSEVDTPKPNKIDTTAVDPDGLQLDTVLEEEGTEATPELGNEGGLTLASAPETDNNTEIQEMEQAGQSGQSDVSVNVKSEPTPSDPPVTDTEAQNVEGVDAPVEKSDDVFISSTSNEGEKMNMGDQPDMLGGETRSADDVAKAENIRAARAGETEPFFDRREFKDNEYVVEYHQDKTVIDFFDPNQETYELKETAKDEVIDRLVDDYFEQSSSDPNETADAPDPAFAIDEDELVQRYDGPKKDTFLETYTQGGKFYIKGEWSADKNYSSFGSRSFGAFETEKEAIDHVVNRARATLESEEGGSGYNQKKYAKERKQVLDWLNTLQESPESAISGTTETEENVDPASNEGDLDAGSAREEPSTVPEIAEGADARPDEGSGDRPSVRADEQPSGPDSDLEGSAEQVAGERGRDSDESEAGGGRDEASTSLDDTPSGTDFRIRDDDAVGKGGWKSRAKQNIEAIRIAKRLDAEGSRASLGDQRKLVLYSGWGASELANGIFPNVKTGKFKDGWGKLGAELRELLTDEEYASASATTQFAHYTSPSVIRSIWGAMERFGFTGGSVVEPGSGIGLFRSLAPDGLFGNLDYTGIEYDPLTALIAKHLHPQSSMVEGDFTTIKLPKDHFDVAIGNPPFSDRKVTTDPEYKSNRFMLHDYFFAKSIDRVRPGGVLAFVTSKGTMDKRDSAARKYLQDRADLVGAIRLPQTAFKENAGTEVVTDILFFKKLGTDGVRSPHGAPFGDVQRIEVDGGTEFFINEYFVDNPHMVLGEHAATGSMYRSDEYTVTPHKGDIEKQIRKAVENLPEGIFERRDTSPETPPAETDYAPSNRKEGGYYLKGSTIMQTRDGVGVEVGIGAGKGKLNKTKADIVKKFVRIRDAMHDLLSAQLEDRDYSEPQKRLNEQYDAFVEKHGPLNKYTSIIRNKGKENEAESKSYTNLNAIADDPDAYFVSGIENFDEETKVASKSNIFTERVVAPEVEAKISTPFDALNVVLNETGRVDIDLIAERMGESVESIIDQLGSSIYKDPAKGSYVTDDEYLSGNVRLKLLQAEDAAKKDPSLQRNVEALKENQPEDLGPDEVVIRLGAYFVPEKYYEQFLAEELGTRATVRANPVTKEFLVEWVQVGVPAMAEYGTPRIDGMKLSEKAINAKKIEITDRIYEEGKEKTVVNKQETSAAQKKANAIKKRFSEWVYEDPERSASLLDIYNQKYNNSVPREYKSDFLTTPGMTTKIKLRPHQKRVVWRIIQSGNTLMAHDVGAGKTMAMIAAGMELKRLGMKNKPAYVVPGHMLKQFTHEFYELYPNAKLLIADEKNFEGKKRQRFFGKVAGSNWDGVIITHEAFGKIPVSDAIERKVIQDVIAQYEDAIVSSSDTMSRKNLEKGRDKLKNKLQTLSSRTTQDKGMTFEEIGIDEMFVDEAHAFKNLQLTTNQGDIKGIDIAASKRAWDMYLKTFSLDTRYKGHHTVFATGTPITNSIPEIFNLMRYLRPHDLEAKGIETFDSWSKMFGETSTAIEEQPDGNYKSVVRFNKFINVPELSQMFRDFADVITGDDLAKYVKRPRVRGGASRELVVTPALDEFVDFQASLTDRIKEIEARGGRSQKGEDNILVVMSDGRKAAIDLRLVDQNAPDNPDSKLNYIIKSVVDDYNTHGDIEYLDDNGNIAPIRGGTQMIFMDVGVNPMEKTGFHAYGWLKKGLIEQGIPESEIAIMGDYKKSDQKLRLFKEMNSGRKKILIGSSKNMGTGVNAQKRLKVLHHADLTYVPSDLKQREGRIVRQGNQNEEVVVKAYAAKGSMDANMWQRNESKQRFIEDIMTGKGGRTNQSASESSQMAMAKALATSDPRVIEMENLRIKQSDLTDELRSHQRQQKSYTDRIRSAKTSIEYRKGRMEKFNNALPQRKDTSGDEFVATVAGKEYDKRADAGKAVISQLKQYQDMMDTGQSFEQKPIKIGEIAGFRILFEPGKAKLDDGFVATASIGLDLGEIDLFSDTSILANNDPAGVAKRLENIAKGLDSKIESYKREIEQLENEIKGFGSRTGASFPRAQELADVTKELNELEAEIEADSTDSTPEDVVVGSLAQDQESRTEENVTELKSILTDLAKKMNPDVDISFVDKIVSKTSDLLDTYTEAAIEGREEVELAGAYYPLRKLIEVALSAGGVESITKTTMHEAFHTLQPMLTDAEIAVLEKAFPGTEKWSTIEHQAMAFQDWAWKRLQVSGPVEKIYRKILRFIHNFGNYIRGMGFISADQVFEDALTGQLAGRDLGYYAELMGKDTAGSLLNMSNADLRNVLERTRLKKVEPSQNVIDKVVYQGQGQPKFLERLMANPSFLFRKYAPWMMQTWRKAIDARNAQSNQQTRFEAELNEIFNSVSPAERADLSNLAFHAEMFKQELTDADLERGYVTEDGEQVQLWDTEPSPEVIAAYKDVRKFLDKVGRTIDKHNRSMRETVLNTKKLMYARLRKSGSGREAARLAAERGTLLTKLKGRFEPDSPEAIEARARMQAINEELEGYSDEIQRAASFIFQADAQLAKTGTILRKTNYIPHRFFGNFAVYRQIEGEPDPETGEPTVAWELLPEESQGFHDTHDDAIRAANAYAERNPDDVLQVQAVAAGMGADPRLLLSDSQYFKMVRNLTANLTTDYMAAGMNEADAKKLAKAEAVKTAGQSARRASRKAFFRAMAKRKGVEGYSRDLPRVIYDHAESAARYMAQNKIKYSAVNAMERNGVTATKAPSASDKEIQKIVYHWFADQMDMAQPGEVAVDEILSQSWVTPLNSALASGAAAFVTAGGMTANPLIGLAVGSYVGYRFYSTMSQSAGRRTRALTGRFLGDMAHLKLGMVFNVFSPFVNASQFLLNTGSILGYEDSANGLMAFQRAMTTGREEYRRAKKGDAEPDPAGLSEAARHYSMLRRHNIDTKYLYSEHEPQNRTGVDQLNEKLSRASLALFSFFEKMNRGATFLAVIKQHERKDIEMPLKQQYDIAMDIVNKTQFDYSNVSKPELLRNVLLRVPLQFKNFMAQQLGFIYGLGKEAQKGDVAPLTRFLFTTFFLAGALGMPGLDLLDEFITWLLGKDKSPILAMKRFGLEMHARGQLPGTVADVMIRGAPSLVNLDLSSRVGMGERFILPDRWSDLKGPWIDTVSRVGQLGRLEMATTGDVMSAVSSGLGRPIKALESVANGLPIGETIMSGDADVLFDAIMDDKIVKTNPWKRGRVELNPTPIEAALGAVGGRSMREARITDAVMLSNTVQEKAGRQTAKVTDMVVKAYRRGDAGDVPAILQKARDEGVVVSPQTIRYALREADKPRTLRQWENMRSLSRERLQSLREIYVGAEE